MHNLFITGLLITTENKYAVQWLSSFTRTKPFFLAQINIYNLEKYGKII